MQSRYWISTHPTFELAKKAKEILLSENPDNTYQIRTGKERDKTIFRVVQRLKRNEADVVQETHNKKPRKQKRAEDFSWIKR